MSFSCVVTAGYWKVSKGNRLYSPSVVNTGMDYGALLKGDLEIISYNVSVFHMSIHNTMAAI